MVNNILWNLHENEGNALFPLWAISVSLSFQNKKHTLNRDI